MRFEPYFLGPKGDNTDMLEELILEVLREHIYWRRNFQPKDPFSATAEYMKISSRIQRGQKDSKGSNLLLTAKDFRTVCSTVYHMIPCT